MRWGLLSTANINKALIDPIRQAKDEHREPQPDRDRIPADVKQSDREIL